LSPDKLDLEEISIYSSVKTLVNISKSDIFTFTIEKIVDCILVKHLNNLSELFYFVFLIENISFIDINQIRLIVADFDNNELGTELFVYKYLDFEMNTESSNNFTNLILNLINYSISPYLIDYKSFGGKNIIKWSRKRHNNLNNLN
jgi:hypothetical protein